MPVNEEYLSREEWIKKWTKRGLLTIGALTIGSLLTKTTEAKNLHYVDSAGNVHNLTTSLATDYLKLDQTTPQKVINGDAIAYSAKTLSYTDGVLTRIDYPSGFYKTFGYTDGVLTSLTYSDGSSKTFTYTDGNLTSISVI